MLWDHLTGRYFCFRTHQKFSIAPSDLSHCNLKFVSPRKSKELMSILQYEYKNVRGESLLEQQHSSGPVWLEEIHLLP